MSESQSRYSIVERLTKQKLDIMGAKSDLKEDLKKKEQTMQELEANLKNWKKDILEDNKREERNLQIELDRAKREAENSKSRVKDKEKVYEEKIKAIDQALSRIEKISESSQS